MGMFSPRFSVDEVLGAVPQATTDRLRASGDPRDRALSIAIASLQRIAGADSPEGDQVDVDAYRNLCRIGRLLGAEDAP